MSVIVVQGYYPLKGEIEIQGSKNAALPMMAAALLHKGATVLDHVPMIQDVFCMVGILESMGCVCCLKDHRLTIDASQVSKAQIPKDRGKAMRSSIVVLGALLGRCGEGKAYYPGGCSIGSRPIDLHLGALRKMGAEIREEGEVISARAPRLSGTDIRLSYPSVGATENVILAAVKAKGDTVLRGAAREPEIDALCRMLVSMGARIQGIGTSSLWIRGVEELRDITYEVPGDRIVTGTYLSAVMAAGGEAVLRRGSPRCLGRVLDTMRTMGARICLWEDAVGIAMDRRPKAVSVTTGPYPGFPTDLQSMAMAVMAVGEGEGYLKETVFEGRFATAKQLHKMGAEIIIEGSEARIVGKGSLKGAKVRACDLRSGAALAVAGLRAEGDTMITDCCHIFRGYEDICGDLRNLGGRIRRES